ncbi:GNAT family N-acetyltransferase [Nesterenkonia halotolerans]|uniref:GNAT family N-acetyltransferase n=1 Tax=Nesterenkonia halotolerans TaxID=225325 RepID=UPI003EE49B53
MEMLRQRVPLWSPSADAAAARVHRATRGQVRVLTHGDTPALHRLLATDPVAHVSVTTTVRARQSAGPGRGRNSAVVMGIDGENGLEAACWAGSNIIPVAATPEQAELFGVAVGALRRRVASIYGEAEAAVELYDATGWTDARDVRPEQPLMSMTEPSPIPPLPTARLSVPEDFSRVEKASAAMFTEELGFSPYAQGASQYRERVRGLIDAGHSIIAEDPQTGEIAFKAEFGAVSPEVVQVQGVWVRPSFRGQGLAAPGMAAVVEHGLRLAPTVSLYVNSYNTAAIRTYQRVGFTQVGTFATILF